MIRILLPGEDGVVGQTKMVRMVFDLTSISILFVYVCGGGRVMWRYCRCRAADAECRSEVRSTIDVECAFVSNVTQLTKRDDYGTRSMPNIGDCEPSYILFSDYSLMRRERLKRAV